MRLNGPFGVCIFNNLSGPVFQHEPDTRAYLQEDRLWAMNIIVSAVCLDTTLSKSSSEENKSRGRSEVKDLCRQMVKFFRTLPTTEPKGILTEYQTKLTNVTRRSCGSRSEFPRPGLWCPSSEIVFNASVPSFHFSGSRELTEHPSVHIRMERYLVRNPRIVKSHRRERLDSCRP